MSNLDMKALGELLKSKKATWKLMPQADAADERGVAPTLESLAKQYYLGEKPAPPDMPKTNMPRLRAAEGSKVIPRMPGTERLRNFGESAPSDALDGVPSSKDWREVGGKNFVGPPRDQSSCGSCVAFAVTAAVEAHYRIQGNQPALNIDLSEASLFFVANRQCNNGDPNAGWWVPSGLDAVVKEGICFEDVYPYVPKNQQADIPNGTFRTLKIKGYDSTTNRDLMKRWLVEEGPLVTRFDVFNDFFAFFTSGTGVYQHVTGAFAGGHAVAVVGYDDARGAWICKNSWGSKPGHPDGCFLIGYGQCGIDARMYQPQDVTDIFTIDEIAYDPRRLVVVPKGSLGWMLTDGRMSMRLFDNPVDARNGLRVARRHTKQCFVGRDNPRTNRRDYILEYWSGNSGLPREPLTTTDSIGYNPANVKAADLDAQGWRIHDGNHWMLIAHDMNDALAMMQVVERHSRICFIGRNNTRPNRKDYIMTYFE